MLFHADVLMSERARAKFRAPRASIAVVDREYVLTFNSDTPPETVTEVARYVAAAAGLHFMFDT